MRPDVVAVIVTYNSAHVISQLLDSLPAAFDGLERSVVVVDNGSTDNTRAVVGARTDCRLIVSTNVGYAAGINLGVRSSPAARSILVLNPDVSLGPSCVRRMFEALAEPSVGIVAPRVVNQKG